MAQQKNTRTLCDMVRRALQARTMNDLHGILLLWSEDLPRLTELVEASLAKAGPVGDKELATSMRRHPICVLYSSRLAMLTGSEVGDRHMQAMAWCEYTLERECLGGQPVPFPTDSN